MLLYVGLWSAVTMAHSLAAGVLSLAALRLLLGTAEGGNWPGAVKAVSENVRLEGRAFAIGVFNSGSTIGALIAPPLVAVVVRFCGWRAMFILVGTLGFLWVMFWSSLYHPRRLPGANLVVLESLPPGSSHEVSARPGSLGTGGRALLCRPHMVVLCLLASCLSCADPRLQPDADRQSGLDSLRLGGHWRVVRRLRLRFLVRHGFAIVKARKIVMLVSAALMLSGIPAFRVQSSALCLACVSVVLFAYTSWASNILSLPADLFSSREVASITGLGGTSAAVGGMLYTLATGWLAQAGSYGAVFLLGSGMIVCAAVALVTLVPASRPLLGNSTP